MQAEHRLSALTKQSQKQKLSSCLSLTYIRARILQGFTFLLSQVSQLALRPPPFLSLQPRYFTTSKTTRRSKRNNTSLFIKQHVVLCEMSAYFPDA